MGSLLAVRKHTGAAQKISLKQRPTALLQTLFGRCPNSDARFVEEVLIQSVPRHAQQIYLLLAANFLDACREKVLEKS